MFEGDVVLPLLLEAQAEVIEGADAFLRIALGQLELLNGLVDFAAFVQQHAQIKSKQQVIGIALDLVARVLEGEFGLLFFPRFRVFGVAGGFELRDFEIQFADVGLAQRAVDLGVGPAGHFLRDLEGIDGLIVLVGFQIQFRERPPVVDVLRFGLDLAQRLFDQRVGILRALDRLVLLLEQDGLFAVLDFGAEITFFAPAAALHGIKRGGVF